MNNNTAAISRIIPALLITLICIQTNTTTAQEKSPEITIDDSLSIIVKPAPEWDALFIRTDGWTGADGVFSIPLTGSEKRNQNNNAKTMIVFGDTFIGKVDPTDHHRLPGTKMVNSTIALLKGNQPITKNISFKYARDEKGNPKSLIIPNTPNAKPDQWYWFADGITINDKTFVFAFRMKRRGTGGTFDFATAGEVLLTTNPTHPFDEPPTQKEMPLFLKKTDTRGEIVFGSAILPNTKESGAPNPDGFIYIYGAESIPFTKKMVVARVKPQHFDDVSKWEFYTGSAWSKNITEAVGMAPRISMSYSVTPIAKNRYLLVFQEDTIGKFVAVRIGESPVGPWGPIHEIYQCPEVKEGEKTMVYNAKAHPHLSKPGELLVSYNVNSGDFWAHFKHANIYHPRFIRLILNENDN